MSDVQRKAAQKRLRERLLDIKAEYQAMDVRDRAGLVALLEIIIDQEVRIENMEARLGDGGNSPSLPR